MSEEIEMTEEETATAWRNQELKDTDWVVMLDDHPERPLYYNYRARLRDWPSTSDFPDTKPTI
jgi:hypothetical protein